MGLSKHPTKREGASEEKERWRKKNKTRTEMTAEKTANRARAHSNAPPGQKDWQRDEAERGKKKKKSVFGNKLASKEAASATWWGQQRAAGLRGEA